MRYLVMPTELDAKHPAFPGETVYKLMDTKNHTVSMGCYTSEEVAQEVADRKNG